MRGVFLALLIAAGIAATIATPAKAENYPFCMTGAVLGGSFDCGYTTLQQCQARASGLAAYCVDSPFLSREPRPYQQPARRRHPGF